MKRSFIIMVSLVLALGLVTVASAEDRLTINGDYYLRAIYIDNADFGKAAGLPAGESVEYFNQRLRTNMTMALSQEMALQLRADWAENDWGSPYQHGRFTDPDISPDGGSPSGYSVRNVLQIEYANLKINKPMWGISLGLQDPIIGYGLGDVYRPHNYGIGVKLNLPVTVNLDLFKASEGGTTTFGWKNDDQDGNDDTNWYSLQVSGKFAGWTIGGWYANLHNLEAETMRHAFELWTRGQVGPVSISGAVDYLFGEQTEDIDYTGTISAMVDAGISITPALRFGGHLYYTSAADDGENNLPNLTVWGPSVNFVAFGMPGVTFDGAGYEIGFQNRNIIGGQGNAGQMGADVYAQFKVLPNVTLAGQVLYVVPADDDRVTNGIDSRLGLSAGVSYNYKPNVIISLGTAYAMNSWDSSVADEPDDPFGVQANFWVLF